MAKLMVLLLLVLMWTVSPFSLVAADSVGVYSNIVGFQRLELVAGRNFVGLNFKNTTEQISYNVQELFDNSTLTGGVTELGSDRMFLWDVAGEKYIELWLIDSKGAFPDWDGKWFDPVTESLAEQEIYPGDGFWLILQNAAEIVLSGEVESATVFNHAAMKGRSLMASAWPVDIPVNDLELSGLTGGVVELGSDRMFLWDQEDQKYIELWLVDSQGAFPDWDGNWFDPVTGSLAEQTLNAGSAFWLFKETDEAVTEGKPF